MGFKVPVVITVYADRSFSFITKTPPASVLLLKAAGLSKGSGNPKRERVAEIKRDKIKEIANKEKQQIFVKFCELFSNHTSFWMFINQISLDELFIIVTTEV